ncbi:LodA/GoxA family CTQ-dependent oxidase [Pseudomonas sp. ACM7]|uniref:LodA/GoxA family CTQ-dependent oxidase n=1 Tax=Pseudomonas sp. ACM7 TaxID=2052956 RepID=UPI00101399CB|nr:LodA/GoxA family CTQ-dependent oxidase [Pseudomonas sp. ACM7]QAY90698.1 hypothetical protein CUN63_12470 [Pseudomonas sp. ACM7]
MQTVYKIHPGIGIARVGPSRSGFYIAGETMGADNIEIDGAGNEVPFAGYKDASMLMRRQAVRFRVFEYERDETTGQEVLLREITAADAQINWSVRLAATKAAQFQKDEIDFEGEVTLIQGSTPRNEDVPIDSLRTEVALAVSGANFRYTKGAEPQGAICNKPIYLGEARTDAEGRLIILPGFGDAFSWPDPIGQERALVDYYDNPGWYDDIADGAVDATVQIGAAAPVTAEGAWVITAPPDFAPNTLAVSTLYDIALQAINIQLPSPLTFTQDIKPLIDRAADLAQTNENQDRWWRVHTLLLMPGDISDNGNSDAARKRRGDIYDAVKAACDGMEKYSLTSRQKTILNRYRSGDFQPAADTGRQPLTLPEELDRAALERCVGGGFLPGIEAGHSLRLPDVFSGLCRLTREQFTDWDGTRKNLLPGLLSGRMACPWQADFMQCQGAWWPSQRPDIAGRTDVDKGPLWARKLVVGKNPEAPQSMLNMVNYFGQLGVVITDQNGTSVEVGRDPQLDLLP